MFLETPYDEVFMDRVESSLIWMPEHGMGFYPVQSGHVYNDGYFDRYREQAATPIGKRLMKFRTELVNDYTDGLVVDIGIGCGAFIEKRGEPTMGFDIMPKAVQWLRDRGLFWEPDTSDEPPAMTFWDSMEHIAKPSQIVNQCANLMFVSMPIYRDADHVLRSKHFRRDEHYWYFTEDGFAKWIDLHGFKVEEVNDGESQIGREDILTFVCRRMGDGHAA